MNSKLIWSSILAILSTIVLSCDPGYYSHEGSCLPCPVGTYQPKSGQNGCTPCPSGEYQSEPGSSSCIECGLNAMPNTDATSCDCKPGTGRNTTLDQCVLCPPGTYSTERFYYSYSLSTSESNMVCEPCERWSYQPNEGQSSCLSCPARSFSATGATSCTVCPHGEAPIEPQYTYSYTNDGSYIYEEPDTMCGVCSPGMEYDSIWRRCTMCKDMYFKADEGLHACVPCPPHSFSTEDRTACSPCEPGTAIMEDGSCGKCPAGSYYSRETPYNYYYSLQPSPEPENSFCLPCATGTFTNYDNIMSSCFTCAGHSFSGMGATECIKCPQDQVLMGNGSCATCQPGTKYDSHLMECVPCGLNQYTRNINERFCRSCAKDTYSYEGSYSCTPVKCPEGNVFVHQIGKCGVCPPGMKLLFYVESPLCINCYVGSVKGFAGNDDCTFCGFGLTSNEDFTECVPDPDYTY